MKHVRDFRVSDTDLGQLCPCMSVQEFASTRAPAGSRKVGRCHTVLWGRHLTFALSSVNPRRLCKVNHAAFQRPNLGRHYPGTRPGRHTGWHRTPSWRWRWERSRCLSLAGSSGCCPTADPSPAPHTGTGTPSRSQRLPETTGSTEKGEVNTLLVWWQVVLNNYEHKSHFQTERS